MAMKTDQFSIPTGDQIVATLCGKSLFIVLDMKEGHLQISLDKESTDLCRFITPFWKYKINK